MCGVCVRECTAGLTAFYPAARYSNSALSAVKWVSWTPRGHKEPCEIIPTRFLLFFTKCVFIFLPTALFQSGDFIRIILFIMYCLVSIQFNLFWRAQNWVYSMLDFSPHNDAVLISSLWTVVTVQFIRVYNKLYLVCGTKCCLMLYFIASNQTAATFIDRKQWRKYWKHFIC